MARGVGVAAVRRTVTSRSLEGIGACEGTAARGQQALVLYVMEPDTFCPPQPQPPAEASSADAWRRAVSHTLPRQLVDERGTATPLVGRAGASFRDREGPVTHRVTDEGLGVGRKGLRTVE